MEEIFKPYQEGVKLFPIVLDCWYNGLSAEQTMLDCQMMGYSIDKGSIIEIWKLLDYQVDSEYDEQQSGRNYV